MGSKVRGNARAMTLGLVLLDFEHVGVGGVRGVYSGVTGCQLDIESRSKVP